MNRIMILVLGIAVSFSACKKDNNDDNNGGSGTFTANLSNTSGTWSAVVLRDTLTIQTDTQTTGGSALVPPQKTLHIYAKSSDSSVLDITLKDYTNISQGNCIRTVNYVDGNYASEYAMFNGNKYYTTAAVTYTINSSSPKVYVGDSGFVNINTCNGTTVSGTIQYRLHNVASPNDTIRLTSGTFTTLTFQSKTSNASITANVDAVPWIGYVRPNNDNNVFTLAPDGSNSNFTDKQLTILAEDVNGNDIRLTIHDAKSVNDGGSIRTTTYFDASSSTDTIHSNGNTITSFVLAEYNGDDADNGTVTITSTDATNHKISGTFSFHINGGVFGTDHTISNGTFTNVSYRVQ